MNLPFSQEAFFAVFSNYNEAVWPAQVGLHVLAVALLFLALLRTELSDRWAAGILGSLWLWAGSVYHYTFFSAVNQAAVVFGAVFVMQGLLIIYFGSFRHQLKFDLRWNGRTLAGAVMVLYALVAYPILAYVFGHRYPAMPTFGVPCPLGIFTFGAFIWTARSMPRHLLIIPVLWAVIGVSAVVNLGVLEDIGLPVAGLVSLYLIMRAKRVRRNVYEEVE